MSPEQSKARRILFAQQYYLLLAQGEKSPGAKAAASVGCSGKAATCGQIASRWLKRPEVQAEIKRLQSATRVQTSRTAADAVEVLWKQVDDYSTMDDVTDEQGHPDLQAAKEGGHMRHVERIVRRVTATEEGESERVELKTYDWKHNQRAAIAQIAKIEGWCTKKVEHSGKVTAQVGDPLEAARKLKAMGGTLPPHWEMLLKRYARKRSGLER